jgi:uncharacterized protein (DUF736 family)
MAYEMKDNSGSLFKNDKATSENSPSHTGTVLIGGVKYYQSAWVKETKDGRKYFSQSFKPVDDTSYAKREPTSQAIDDEVPF